MPTFPDVINKPILEASRFARWSGADPDRKYGKEVLVGYEGPAIVVCPAPGNAYPYPDVNAAGLRIPPTAFQLWADLRDSPAWDLDGLATLSIEFFVAPDDAPGAPRWMIRSGGREFAVDGIPQDCAVGISFLAGSVKFQLTTTAGFYELITPYHLVVSGEHHVACVYDGSQMLIYLDGVLKSSQAATGTVVQKPWEWVCFGGYATDLHLGWQESGLACRVRWLRLSDVVRRTGPFTPSTWLPWDATKDRFFGYFDKSSPDYLYGPMVSYYTRWGGIGWLLTRSNTYALQDQSNVEICDVSFVGGSGNKSSIFGVGAVDLMVQRVRSTGSRFGVQLFNNCYNVVIRDCAFDGGAMSRAGIQNTVASGVQTFEQVELYGFKYGLIAGVGSLTMRNAWIGPSYCGIWASCPVDPGVVLDLSGTVVTHENTSGQQIVSACNIKLLTWIYGVIDSVGVPFRLRNVLNPPSLAMSIRYPSGPVCDGATLDTSRCALVPVAAMGLKVRANL